MRCYMSIFNRFLPNTGVLVSGRHGWHAAISQGDHADNKFRSGPAVCLRISNMHSSGSRGVSGSVTAWKETDRYLLAAEEIAPGYGMLKRGKERLT
jgi:hypothetical protein